MLENGNVSPRDRWERRRAIFFSPYKRDAFSKAGVIRQSDDLNIPEEHFVLFLKYLLEKPYFNAGLRNIPGFYGCIF